MNTCKGFNSLIKKGTSKMLQPGKKKKKFKGPHTSRRITDAEIKLQIDAKCVYPWGNNQFQFT